MQRFYFIFLFSMFLLPHKAQAEPLQVVCSFSIICDMVQQVGGEDITVIPLVGPDSDSHAYEPSPADARKIAHAQLIITNGLGFEGWISRLIAASGYKGPVVEASHGINALKLQESQDKQEHTVQDDPHAWHSIPHGIAYVATIRNALVESDAAHASAYHHRAAAYIKQLEELDTWARAQIAAVPLAKRKVITSHDAFQYLAKEYGITFLAPQGLNSLSHASAGDVARLIDAIRHYKVRALFLENFNDPRMMQQISRDSGAIIQGTLYADSLSPEDGPAPNYMELLHHNIVLLVNAMRQNPD